MNGLGFRFLAALLFFVAVAGRLSAAENEAPEGFVTLFNGKDFTGWKVPEGDNGHWKVLNGVIDYDARSESKGDKCLWTDKSFSDFVLRIDWRMKTDEPGFTWRVPELLPDGSPKKGPDGNCGNRGCGFRNLFARFPYQPSQYLELAGWFG
jgi:hypothetical protein